MKMFKYLNIFCFLSFTHYALAVDIEVKGLFKNGAIFVINGHQQVLKAGEQAPEGITLIEANSKFAVIEINGERRTVYLSNKIGTQYAPAETAEVRVNSGANDHFRPLGRINGRPVRFLVDTGASAVVMSSVTAQSLGVSYKDARTIGVNTAIGLSSGYVVSLNSVSVGDIRLNNIEAIVVEGSFPTDILLGNTFLSRLDMKVENNVLILKSRF